MAETYCGKNCAECTYKEALSCPGCAAGPGKRYYTECDLAKCCADKGHSTCDTCQLQSHCGTYRGKERMPEHRIREREAEQAIRDRLAERSPILGKWLWILFWLVIPSNLASLMTNENVAAVIPSLFIPGVVLQGVTVLVYGLILLRLGNMEERYKPAAICCLVSGLVPALLLLLVGNQAGNWTLLLTIPATIVGMVGKYNEFMAHSEVLQDMDMELSEKWEMLWKWYIGCYAAVIGSLLLVVIVPVLGLLVTLAAAIGIIVIDILQMVYLYKTAKLFRLCAALPEEA